jgi:hypothetical protein
VDQETLATIQELSLLDHMEVLAVPAEASLKALLKQEKTQ